MLLGAAQVPGWEMIASDLTKVLSGASGRRVS